MVDIRLIPRTECLKDTLDRILPYWYDTIVPEIKVRMQLYASSFLTQVSHRHAHAHHFRLNATALSLMSYFWKTDNYNDQFSNIAKTVMRRLLTVLFGYEFVALSIKPCLHVK